MKSPLLIYLFELLEESDKYKKPHFKVFSSKIFVFRKAFKKTINILKEKGYIELIGGIQKNEFTFYMNPRRIKIDYKRLLEGKDPERIKEALDWKKEMTVQEFQRESVKHLIGKDFSLVNDKGEVIFTVFAGEKDCVYGLKDRYKLESIYEFTENLPFN